MANPLASVSIVGRRPQVAILGIVEFPLCVAVAAGEGRKPSPSVPVWLGLLGLLGLLGMLGLGLA